jgi:hypothetical protein
VAALLLFVEQHPELKEEFESFENSSLDDLSSIEFPNKASLKKEINSSNKEEYFIGFIENTLPVAEQKLLSQFLKQNPQSIGELELFKKTIINCDSTIQFENKKSLKKTIVFNPHEDRLIAAAENILTANESRLLTEQLVVDKQLRKILSLYQQTVLVADKSIVFGNKEFLKRKATKVVAFYYYATAVAASILLIFGLFFLFNSQTTTDLADKNAALQKKNSSTTTKNEIATAITNTTKQDNIASITLNKKENNVISKGRNVLFKFPSKSPNSLLYNTGKSFGPVLTLNNNFVVIHSPVITGSDNLAPPETQQNKAPNANEVVSIKELATEKIKQKLLDENSIAEQKKTGQFKKMSGWDIAQLFAKGVSKVSGKKVEVIPRYNNEGDVTAYALTAGAFQLSKNH